MSFRFELPTAFDDAGAPICRSRQAGLSLVEATVAVAILTVLIAAAGNAIVGMNSVFAEDQTQSRITHRARRAMERIVSTVSQAVTKDPTFAGIQSDGGGNFHGLQFRMLSSVVSGAPVYDDVAKVFVYGAHQGTFANAGVILGRGGTLAAIHAAAAGSDNVLGTVDDNTSVSISGGPPAVELLVPSTFAPSQGDMLTIAVDLTRRSVTVTLRLNAPTDDGFAFDTDIVLQERVSLRQ